MTILKEKFFNVMKYYKLTVMTIQNVNLKFLIN